MKNTNIRYNLKGLESLRKQIGDEYVARVGILGEKAVRQDPDSGLNNAEIGLIQMVGSFTHNIPARDWLRFPIEYNRRNFIKDVQASSGIKAALKSGDYKKVFLLIGAIGEKYILRAFSSGGYRQWAPNSPRTIAAKGSNKPLIDTGQLMQAVSSDVVKKGSTGGVKTL